MTYWRVEEITERPGIILAELRRLEFYKTNPEKVALDAEYDAFLAEHGEAETEEKYLGIEWPEEFIDAEPGEDGASSIEGDGPKIVLDISNGPEMHPLDVIEIDVRVLAGVEIDA